MSMDDTLAQMRAEQDRETALASSALATYKTNPEQHAQAQALARKSGLPVDVLPTLTDEAKLKILAASFQSLADKAPKTADFVTDPSNAALVSDSVENLADTETSLQKTRSVWQTTKDTIHEIGTALRRMGPGFTKSLAGASQFIDKVTHEGISDPDEPSIYAKTDADYKARAAAAGNGVLGRISNAVDDFSRNPIQTEDNGMFASSDADYKARFDAAEQTKKAAEAKLQQPDMQYSERNQSWKDSPLMFAITRGIENAPIMAPQLAGGMLTAAGAPMLGVPLMTAGTGLAFGSQGSETYDEVLKKTGNEHLAILAGVGTGAVEIADGFLDYLTGKIFTASGAKQALSAAAKRQAIDGLIEKYATDATAKGALKAAGRVAKGTAFEGATEAAQGVAQLAITDQATGENSGLDKYINAAMENGLPGAFMGASIGGAHNTHQYFSDRSNAKFIVHSLLDPNVSVEDKTRAMGMAYDDLKTLIGKHETVPPPDVAARSILAALVAGNSEFETKMDAALQAHANAEGLGSMQNLVEAAKVITLNPEKAEELYQSMADEHLPTVSIPVAEFVRHYTELGLDPAVEAERITGGTAALEDALQTGGDVVIPTHQLFTRVMAQGQFEGLRDHIKIDPDGMTVAEANEWEKTGAAEQFKQHLEALQATSPRQQVFNSLRDELVKARYTPDQADAQAHFWANRYETRAANFEGKTAADLYEQDKAIRVNRAKDPVLQPRNVDPKLEGNLNALRLGKIPTAKQVRKNPGLAARRQELLGLQDKLKASGYDLKEHDNKTIVSGFQAQGNAQQNPNVTAAVDKINKDGETLVSVVDEAIAPVYYSTRTWTADEKSDIKSLAEQMGIEEEKVDDWISAIDNVMVRVLADPSLDFYAESADLYSALKANSDDHYVVSLDFSTLCRKRYELMATVEAVQQQIGRAITKETWVEIRSILDAKGIPVSCGACYVDAKRMESGKFVNDFIAAHPDEDPAQFLSQAGIDKLKREKPDLYKQFKQKLGSNNAKTPEARTDYHGEIRWFFGEGRKQDVAKTNETGKAVWTSRKNTALGKERVAEMNKKSGLRWQSWSDFEVPHLMDAMQAIVDMHMVGLAGHAYTKVPDLVRAMGKTGLMLNMSLIPKGTGLDAKENLVFDPKEGMDFEEALALREQHEQTTGTIAIGASNEHIMAMMADPRIDYIIPYHASGLAGDIAKKFNMNNWVDYTDTQTEDIADYERFHEKVGKNNPALVELWAKGEAARGEYRKAARKLKLTAIDTTDYWDYSKSGDENAAAYLAMAKDLGIAPKFRGKEYANGKVLQDFTEHPGYWKLLIDRKMYDHSGRGIEQRPVQPVYDEEVLQQMLNDAAENPIPSAADNATVNEIAAKLGYEGPEFTGGSDLLHQTAWHGGPHTFDKFTTQKIGAGEGAQVYGWGLYFASVKEVADWYRETTSDGKFMLYDGVKTPVDDLYTSLTDQLIAAGEDGDRAQWLADMVISGGNIQDAQSHARSEKSSDILEYFHNGLEPLPITRLEDVGKSYIGVKGGKRVEKQMEAEDYGNYRAFRAIQGEAHFYDNPVKSIRERNEKTVEVLTEKQAELKQQIAAEAAKETPNRVFEDMLYKELVSTEKDIRESSKILSMMDKYELVEGKNEAKGRLYKVDLQPKEDEYLNWDKPLSEQSETVKAAIATMMGENKAPEDLNDDELYAALGGLTTTLSGKEKKGSGFYKELSQLKGSDKAASEYLLSLGIRGIKYLDGSSRGAGEGSHNYVIFDDNDVTIEQMWQSKNQPKGTQYLGSFSPSLREIKLYSKADLSTFLHETGHAWLEELRKDAGTEGVSEQVQQDWATIKEWLGIPEGSNEITREQHERFAEGFESYLQEGKAPSIGLRDIFRRFASWLTQVYKGNRQLLLQLTPEVRRVMDRLIATDEEIAHAEAYQGQMDQTFATAEDAGMTEVEFANYKKEAKAAHDAAIEQLNRQQMQEQARERKTWWQKERLEKRAEVEAEAKKSPAYQATQLLLYGKNFEGDEFEGGIKLNKAELIALYNNKGMLKELPKGKAGALVYKEGGMPIEQAAGLLGYDSADALVKDLLNNPKMSDWIEAETDNRMREEHGDMLTDGTLPEEAQLALHNETAAKVKEMELAAIDKKRRQVGKFVKTGVKEVADQAAKEKAYQTRWAEAERKLAVAIESGAKQEVINKLQAEVKALKAENKQNLRTGSDLMAPVKRAPLAFYTAAAKEMIDKISFDKLSPRFYLQAERASAKEAARLFRKGDFDGAATAKEREILNHALYVQASKARAQFLKMEAWGQKQMTRKELAKVGRAGDHFLYQIRNVLEWAGFDRGKNVPELDDIQESLQDFMKRLKDNYVDLPVDPEWFANVMPHYSQMTLPEFTAVIDAAKAIKQAAVLLNTVIYNGERMSYDEAVDLAVNDINTQHAKSLDVPLTSHDSTWIQGVTSKVKKLGFAIRTPQSIFAELGGDQDNRRGVMRSLMWTTYNDASAKESELKARLLPKINEIVDGAGLDEKRLKQQYQISGLGKSLSVYDMIGITLNRGNESNLDKLMRGGIVVGQERVEITQAMLDEIAGHLTEKEMDVIQGLWDMVDSLKGDMQALERRTFGIEPEWIKPTPLIVNGKTYAGGYWPVAGDSRYSRIGAQQEAANNIQEALNIVPMTSAFTKQGHLQARTKAVYPLSFDWQSIVARHLDHAITDIAYREFIISSNKILQSQRIKTAIVDKLGEHVHSELGAWLRSIVGTDPAVSSAMAEVDRMRQTFRRNSAVAYLGYKLYNAFTDVFVTPIQVWSRVDSVSVMASLRDTLTHYSETKEQIQAMSPYMKYLWMNVDRDMSKSMKELTGKHGAVQQAQMMALECRSWAYEMGAMIAWQGAYRDATVNKGLSGKEAVDYADDTVRETTDAGRAGDLNVMLRNPNLQEFTLFMGQQMVMVNAAMTAIRIGKRKGWTKTSIPAKTFVGMVLSNALYDAMLGRAPDMDDDKEKWAKWLAAKILMFPLSAIPILRDIGSAVESAAMGEMSSAKAPAIYTAGDNLWKAAKHLYKVATDEEEAGVKTAKSVVNAAGLAVGAPSSEANILLEYMSDLYTGNYEPEHPWSWALDLFMKRHKKPETK